MSQSQISQSIFKAYDIRGIVGKTLDADVARSIGQAFGSAVAQAGRATPSSSAATAACPGPELSARWPPACSAPGVDVIDLGMVATPMRATSPPHRASTASAHRGIMVTGSHNPPDYNGFKMVLRRRGDLRRRDPGAVPAHRRRATSRKANGSYRTHDITQAYLDRIIGDVKLGAADEDRVDCGNGVAGAFARRPVPRAGLRT